MPMRALILKRQFHRARKQLNLSAKFFFHRQLVEQVAGKINAANSARDNRVARNFVDARKQVEGVTTSRKIARDTIILSLREARRQAVSLPEGYKSRPTRGNDDNADAINLK